MVEKLIELTRNKKIQTQQQQRFVMGLAILRAAGWNLRAAG